MPTFKPYRYNPETRHHELSDTEIEVPRPILTARQLLVALEVLVRDNPHLADLPVHVLDMNPDDGRLPEFHLNSGLLTDIETEIFDEKQGLVLDLISWPQQKADSA